MEGFRALIELHVILSAAREKARQQEKLQSDLDALDSRLNAARERLAEAEAKVKRFQVDKKAAELEVGAIELTRRKYREQLMGAKTNEIYRTLLSEIESSSHSLSDKETVVLQCMEGLEAAQAEVKQAEDAIAAAQAALAVEAKVLRAELESLRAAKDKDDSQAKALEPRIPRDLLERFHRISAARNGRGLALAVNFSCSECHVAVRPQVWVELAARPGSHQCAGCVRLLYREEILRPTVAAPVPGEVPASTGTS